MKGWLLPAAVLLVAAASAQEAGEDAEKPRGWLRLLPVGDLPPFRQEIRNGVRVELPPPPGSVPPRRILVPGAGEEATEQRLQLGTATSPVVTTAGVRPLLSVGESGAGPAWMKVRMPEHPAALAILFRDPRADTWDQARSLVLRDDLATHPEGAVRVVNASVFLARVEVGDESVDLAPGKTFVRRREGSGEQRNIPLRVAVRLGPDWVPIYDSGLSQARGERTNVVIYRSDGKRPRRPAKALVLKERAFLPPLPKRDPAGS